MRPVTLPSGKPPTVRPLRTPPLSARKLERTFGQRWPAFKLLLDLIRRGRNGSGFAWRAKAVRRAHNKHRLKVPVNPPYPKPLTTFQPWRFRTRPKLYEKHTRRRLFTAFDPSASRGIFPLMPGSQAPDISATFQ